MATVHMMVGIPGSGKSYYSNYLNKLYGYHIISTDRVRMEHPDWEESLIWPEVYQLVGYYLKNNEDVIFDATNITPKVRNRFKDEVNKHYTSYDMIAYYFDTPVDECVKRVDLRNNLPGNLFLPLDVIKSYGERIIKPTLDEGFKKIIEIKNN